MLDVRVSCMHAVHSHITLKITNNKIFIHTVTKPYTNLPLYIAVFRIQSSEILQNKENRKTHTTTA